MTGMEKRAETDASLATFLIRVGIGLLFFFAGINKMFFHKVLEDGSSLSGPFGWAAGNIENFSKTWLPGILLYPFSYSLPFVELILGALLIIGFRTRLVLFATGILLLHLVFGMVLLQQSQVVSQNLIYLFIVAFALSISRYNRFSVDGMRGCGS